MSRSRTIPLAVSGLLAVLIGLPGCGREAPADPEGSLRDAVLRFQLSSLNGNASETVEHVDLDKLSKRDRGRFEAALTIQEPLPITVDESMIRIDEVRLAEGGTFGHVLVSLSLNGKWLDPVYQVWRYKRGRWLLQLDEGEPAGESFPGS